MFEITLHHVVYSFQRASLIHSSERRVTSGRCYTHMLTLEKIELCCAPIKKAASHSHLDVISSIWRHLENEAKASQNINTNFLAITYTHRHIIQKN